MSMKHQRFEDTVGHNCEQRWGFHQLDWEPGEPAIGLRL